MLDDKDIENYARRLKEMRAEIEDLRGKSKEARAAVDLDQTKVGRLSRMDALQGQAMARETERRRGLELQRIEGALQRIASGDFGYCVTCDEEIDRKRLDFNPAIPICIQCARGREE